MIAPCGSIDTQVLCLPQRVGLITDLTSALFCACIMSTMLYHNAMRNSFEVFGRVVRIEVWHKKQMYCWCDTADLALIQSLDVMWNAQPARAPAGKFYCQAKVWNATRKRCETLMFHRIILGLTDPNIEGHHKDNDGLNNRRENLEPLNHKRNMRERTPSKDWQLLDARRAASDQYRAERKIAAAIAEQFDLTRQGLWKIRTQQTKGSRAAFAYFDACQAAEIKPLWEQRTGPAWASKSGVGRDSKVGGLWA